MSSAAELGYTGDGSFANFRAVSDAVETVTISGADAGSLLIASHAANVCARVMSLADGGQTLLTRHTFSDARQSKLAPRRRPLPRTARGVM